MLHSLSRALHEEVQFDTEKVTSVDWVIASDADARRHAGDDRRRASSTAIRIRTGPTCRTTAPARRSASRCSPRSPTRSSTRPACGCAACRSGTPRAGGAQGSRRVTLRRNARSPGLYFSDVSRDVSESDSARDVQSRSSREVPGDDEQGGIGSIAGVCVGSCGCRVVVRARAAAWCRSARHAVDRSAAQGGHRSGARRPEADAGGRGRTARASPWG